MSDRRYTIHTPGDLILTMGEDGGPRAYKVIRDGSLVEQADPGVATMRHEDPALDAMLTDYERRVADEAAKDAAFPDSPHDGAKDEVGTPREDPTVADYLLLTFLVTQDGERGHPMDTTVTRIDLTADGAPTGASIVELTDRVQREVQLKAKRTGKAGAQ